MKRTKLLATLPAFAFGAALCALVPAASAQAQEATSQTTQNGNTRLTVSAQGSTTRTPDLATYSAGVTTQGATASEALSANSKLMSQVIAALKKAGVADKDVQTSNLSLNPVYAPPRRQPDGSYVDEGQRIIGYQASNTVSVRQRKLDDMGKVIDALVTAGANQVNGPSFGLSSPDAAQDEARVDAMKKARARAELYARAAGLRVVRIVSISESGGYSPQPVAMRAMAKDEMVRAAAPVEAGELELNMNVTVQFELAQ